MAAGRTDVASRIVAAPPERVYAAMVDPDALTEWLPPAGMSGRFDHYDARPGGTYCLVLTYEDSDAAAGKATPESDIVEARFVELEPGFAGTMTMTWELAEVDSGTRVEFRAENVPSGISAEDHQSGLTSSLWNLAAHVGG